MTRKEYAHHIWVYEKRRMEMKAKMSEKISKLSRKIKLWKRAIRRIDERKKKVEVIGQAVSSFIGYSIKNSSKMRGGNGRHIGRGIFYKYCLEKKISGDVLMEYTKDKSPSTPGRVRRDFTNSFKAHPDRRELYHRFLRYIGD